MDSLASPGSSDKQAGDFGVPACLWVTGKAKLSEFAAQRQGKMTLPFFFFNSLALNTSFSPTSPPAPFAESFSCWQIPDLLHILGSGPVRFDFCYCLLFVDVVEFCPSIRPSCYNWVPRKESKLKKKKISLNSGDNLAIFVGYFLKWSDIWNRWAFQRYK